MLQCATTRPSTAIVPSRHQHNPVIVASHTRHSPASLVSLLEGTSHICQSCVTAPSLPSQLRHARITASLRLVATLAYRQAQPCPSPVTFRHSRATTPHILVTASSHPWNCCCRIVLSHTRYFRTILRNSPATEPSQPRHKAVTAPPQGRHSPATRQLRPTFVWP